MDLKSPHSRHGRKDWDGKIKNEIIAVVTLHDKTLCAYPNEKEYLIGDIGWFVTKITE